MFLNTREAFKAMSEGKTIRPYNIEGIEICQKGHNFLFKHRDGTVEQLHHKTIEDDDKFILVNENNTIMHKMWEDRHDYNRRILK